MTTIKDGYQGPCPHCGQMNYLALNVEQKNGETEKNIKAAVGIIMDAVVETIGADGHQWSDRPCQTCLAVTSLIGRPFGCYWYQEKLKGG